jgi:Amt family ammonium transporter
MMMNFMVYGVGMLAYWLIGFTIQMGGVGGVANLGGVLPLNTEWAMNIFGKPFGLFGQHGIFLTQGAPMTSRLWSYSCSRWYSWTQP